MSPIGLRLPLLALAAFALVACSPFGQQTQNQIYHLASSEVAASTEAPLTQTLRLETPRANRTLDSARILVQPQAHTFNAYPGARWSDTAPTLVREHLVEAFRQHQSFAAVVKDNSRARVDLELASDLRAFHAEHRDGATRVLIVLEAQLLDSRTQKVVASQRFDISTDSDASDLDSVVRAFGRATDQLGQQLLDWTRGHAAEH